MGIAGRQNGLSERVRGLLPAALKAHCLGADVKDGQLRITMDSPAWAARLRYLLAKLAPELKALSNPPAQSVQIRTGSPRPAAKRAAQQKPGDEPCSSVSEESRQHIRESARHIADPRLRRALEQLAQGPKS